MLEEVIKVEKKAIFFYFDDRTELEMSANYSEA